MHNAITIKGEGNRYQRVLYTLTELKNYLYEHPNECRRFVVDEDVVKDIKNQFKLNYKITSHVHKWGAMIEETYVIFEDKK